MFQKAIAPKQSQKTDQHVVGKFRVVLESLALCTWWFPYSIGWFHFVTLQFGWSLLADFGSDRGVHGSWPRCLGKTSKSWQFWYLFSFLLNHGILGGFKFGDNPILRIFPASLSPALKTFFFWWGWPLATSWEFRNTQRQTCHTCTNPYPNHDN